MIKLPLRSVIRECKRRGISFANPDGNKDIAKLVAEDLKKFTNALYKYKVGIKLKEVEKRLNGPAFNSINKNVRKAHILWHDFQSTLSEIDYDLQNIK